jgi:hypothetical protein
MKPSHRAWLVVLVAGIVFSLTHAIPAIGSARYEKSLHVNDGYGDFYTLFVTTDDSTGATKSTAQNVLDMARQGKDPLVWAIQEDRLPGAFTWLSVVLDQGSRSLLKVIGTMAVTSLIPSGILLVGIGTLCLIGIRRRDRSQA